MTTTLIVLATQLSTALASYILWAMLKTERSRSKDLALARDAARQETSEVNEARASERATDLEYIARLEETLSVYKDKLNAATIAAIDSGGKSLANVSERLLSDPYSGTGDSAYPWLRAYPSTKVDSGKGGK